MYPYISIIKDQLSQNMPYYGEDDVNSVLEMLYSIYRKRSRGDSEAVGACFSQLDEVLQKLTLKDYDKVWNAACNLHSTVEKEAFLEGIRVGATLVSEIGT